MTKISDLKEIEITPGVMPSTDATPSDIPCWAMADKIRFDPTTGRPRKIGGWVSNTFDYSAAMSGTCRSVFSATINGKVYTTLGTNSYQYSLIGSRLTNITPLKTTPVAAANSLDTHYDTLASNPLTTVNGSALVVVADTEASLFKVNDVYVLSGATTTNGIPNTELNATHIVRAVGTNTITIRTSTAATSSGTGGGASVVRTSGLLTLNKASHGLTNGMRVKIAGAATFGGILNTEINGEFIVRNVVSGSFDFMTLGKATSSVTLGGGASTEYYEQIAAGPVDQGQGQGYGAGLYGIGLYGTALVSSQGQVYPRIWFFDRYGDNIISTAGNQTGVYKWSGSNDVAPALVPNAPTEVNYAFISDNTLVTFGYDVENKIFASDQGNIENWTASSTNTVFEDQIEGAGRLISHCPLDTGNLIFTEQQTYTFKFVGGTAVWQIFPLDYSIGIIAPMARVSINGYAYWMGRENFYFYRGGKIEVMPSNVGTCSTILHYVFDDLNYSQRFKIFAWYNKKYDEIWWHYPSSNSLEPDRVARYSRKLGCWVPDTMIRTAAEYPNSNLSNPRLANTDVLYTHESGSDADGSTLPFTMTTKKYTSDTQTALMAQIVPDSNTEYDLSLLVRSSLYPQSSANINENTYTVTPTSARIDATINGRFWDYTISGNALGQSFLMGQWREGVQVSAKAP